MKTSEALKATKARLWDGISDPYRTDSYAYICNAAANISDEVMAIVQPLVMDRLRPFATVRSWLAARENRKLTCAYVQGARFALVDSLIHEYESQGD